MGGPKDVDEFIKAAPKEARTKLQQVRSAIREGAPEAIEEISYGMPFYRFRGESGFRARLCYFGLKKKTLVFYTRPLFLERYLDEVGPYMTTKSALHFSLDGPIPLPLIRKLVKEGNRKHRAERSTDPD
ncbi:MAG TPA: DUF1801 domain-containing protein [Thermoplasmata archaeon]|nr:DUF1801 domain-containing protein [Thermoplasmata archaeon]